MPIRRRLSERTIDEPRLEIMPLIDVIFLLLTFFVFALVLMVRADALDVRLPTLSSGEPARAGDVVTVTVVAQGDLRVMGEPVEEEQLAEQVRTARDAIVATGGDPRILVAADENAPTGALLRVLDRLAQEGLGDVSVIGRPAGE